MADEQAGGVTTNSIRVTLAGQSWVFSEDTADNVELIDVEKATGWDLGEWFEHIDHGSMRGLTALVWLLRRRDEPGLAFADVKFKIRDLRVEFVAEDEAEGKAPLNGSSTATSSPSPSTSA